MSAVRILGNMKTFRRRMRAARSGMRAVRSWTLRAGPWLGLLCVAPACGPDDASPPAQLDAPEFVVLVHGLGRTEHSMAVLAQRLRWAGYEVAVVGYESLSAPVSEHVAAVREAVERCCAEAGRVHFVGHSLGGIVVRSYLGAEPPRALGRVVLLSPPNRGSELAERLREIPLASDALGPSGRVLGTRREDLPARLPPPAYEMGVIMGNRSLNPVSSAMIQGPDDGIVAVERGKLADVPMVVLPRSHTFIMNSRHAADAVVQFLRTGSFDDDAGKRTPSPG